MKTVKIFSFVICDFMTCLIVVVLKNLSFFPKFDEKNSGLVKVL